MPSWRVNHLICVRLTTHANSCGVGKTLVYPSKVLIIVLSVNPTIYKPLNMGYQLAGEVWGGHVPKYFICWKLRNNRMVTMVTNQLSPHLAAECARLRGG